MSKYDITIIGGGIVGLATGVAIMRRFPKARLLILEKEHELAAHQTGNNSGVIHTGIYSKPGSAKAEFCRKAQLSMLGFCQANGIPYDICGKLIVATEPQELPLLENIYQRGLQNQVEMKLLTPEEAKEKEPYVRCIKAIHVLRAGIVNYRKVAEELSLQIQNHGGEIATSNQVIRILDQKGLSRSWVCETLNSSFESQFLINCGGLFSDRIARISGLAPSVRIVPFRGEYYELRPEKRSLVKNLIYPVPNPQFPFLGVHFTRMINGEVHAGPNAVLAFKREGYHFKDFSLKDSGEVFFNPNFIRFAYKNFGEGIKEMTRSLSKKLFVRSLRRLIPEVREEDLVPSSSGVRAQAMGAGGKLVDDFLILEGRKAIHVLNAPSPAATCSIEIGEAIAGRVQF